MATDLRAAVDQSRKAQEARIQELECQAQQAPDAQVQRSQELCLLLRMLCTILSTTSKLAMLFRQRMLEAGHHDMIALPAIQASGDVAKRNHADKDQAALVAGEKLKLKRIQGATLQLQQAAAADGEGLPAVFRASMPVQGYSCGSTLLMPPDQPAGAASKGLLRP